MRIHTKKNSNSNNSGIVSGKNMFFFSLYDSESDMRINKKNSDSNNSGIVSGRNMFFV
jgi:hypothetical protein